MFLSAQNRLMREYQQMTMSPPENISAGLLDETNVFIWQFALLGPQGSMYENGYFTGIMEFPKDYPLKPPKLRFTSPIIHPNVYPNTQEVCMSILHTTPDVSGYEKETELWSPASNVASILLSLLSLLSDPGWESPANVDAAVLYRKNPNEYRRQAQMCVRQSLQLE
ncbi:hypothetical protein GEMRC1_008009 [Eukaryota sp. GEM-RC1]